MADNELEEQEDPDFGLIGGPDPEARNVPSVNGITRPAFRAWLSHPCGKLLTAYLTARFDQAKRDAFQLWLDGRFDAEPFLAGETRGQIAMLTELCPISFDQIAAFMIERSPPVSPSGGEGEHGTEAPLQAEDGDRDL